MSLLIESIYKNLSSNTNVQSNKYSDTLKQMRDLEDTLLKESRSVHNF